MLDIGPRRSGGKPVRRCIARAARLNEFTILRAYLLASSHSASAVMLRSFCYRLALVFGFVVLAGPSAQAQFEPACVVEEASVAALQAAMTEGRCTARQITEAYLARIESIDRSGPALRSVLTVNPDALAIADALDAERAAGTVRGPLHGIPVLVKDNVGTADRMPTTAGALALEGVIAPADAGIVERMREAGAIILGKANLSEWANFRSTNSSSGWSALGGQTKNPYVLDRSPCGSSAGTGAALAASLAAVGVGTETDGSIVCPSSANGLVGIKPTVGLVSRAGIIPLSHSQDTAGPMARTVEDAALLLSAMAGSDPADTTTAAAASHVSDDYAQFLDADGLQGRFKRSSQRGCVEQWLCGPIVGTHPAPRPAFASSASCVVEC